MNRDGVEPGATARRMKEVLARDGFRGDFETGLGARYVASTDNSIYQVVPAAIAYPRSDEDVRLLVRTAARSFGHVPLTPRGGNTGTNGQSLNNGVIVDFGRHMRSILHLDAESGVVRVEPGVVLDQLNAFLALHGRFFPPMVSTASRATIGGMVATDASGKGSRRYGKTSDYIAALDITLSDGTDWRAEPMPLREAERIAAGTGIVADIHREALRIVTERAADIAAVFPRMNRGLTGYNLQSLYDAELDRFFLGYLLAGSEGTLALIRSITLRTAVKPTEKALVVIRYAGFDAALRDVPRLVRADPLAIEILDDKVLEVARGDIVWNGVEALLGKGSGRPVAAMNFVEFADVDAARLEEGVDVLRKLLSEPHADVIDVAITRDPVAIAQLWALREKAVGLLARLGGSRQGVPFVEDTAVPPERLADYVADFRSLLDRHGLEYGMFGHADVGCLHVRPLLDLRDPAQAALIRPISDEVVKLTRAYGGLLWGEHGRGFRGEYLPIFFGPLFEELTRLKAAFDPANRLNPGKLVAPPARGAVDRIDAVPLRADADRTIRPALGDDFDRAVACNGNGACFSWNALDALCPSYKVTRDRAQSPKGRASLLRAWARLSSLANPDVDQRRDLADIESAATESLSTCLACKACTTMCPVNVDIPAMKSRFLAHLYTKQPRPLAHWFLARLEAGLSIGRRAPRLANMIVRNPVSRALIANLLGLVDLPAFAGRTSASTLPTATPQRIGALAADRRERAVVLVEDTFTSSFDVDVVRAAGEVLEAWGYTVFRLPPRPNGKVLHLLGMRERFAALAKRRMRECGELAACGAKLVGLDAATMLMFLQEFAEFAETALDVVGIEQLLANDIADGGVPPPVARRIPGRFRVAGHCTEHALRPQSATQWLTVLHHVGIDVASVKTGCCGMAGLFGHDRANLAMSYALFELSWKKLAQDSDSELLATGFSCRCQTKRIAGFRPRHPVELLHQALCGDVVRRAGGQAG